MGFGFHGSGMGVDSNGPGRSLGRPKLGSGKGGFGVTESLLGGDLGGDLMDRRDMIRLLAALPFLGTNCGSRKEVSLMLDKKARAEGDGGGQVGNGASGNMPVVFAAHGAPILLDDVEWMAQLRNWALAMPRPKAVLMVSAHWEESYVTLGATSQVPLVYDFYGFPQKYYETRYPCPPAPDLATRVGELLTAANQKYSADPQRGLDHGAYVPLAAMYPGADVPVLQVSMPRLEPEKLVTFGQCLSPLRSEGILIFGSGFLTHNMNYAFRTGIPPWAKAFDDWVADALARLDMNALKNFQTLAPSAADALPTWEHYAPVLIAAAAASAADEVSFPITGWWLDSAFTKRSVQFG